jgi:hypothetical protein
MPTGVKLASRAPLVNDGVDVSNVNDDADASVPPAVYTLPVLTLGVVTLCFGGIITPLATS